MLSQVSLISLRAARVIVCEVHLLVRTARTVCTVLRHFVLREYCSSLRRVSESISNLCGVAAAKGVSHSILYARDGKTTFPDACFTCF